VKGTRSSRRRGFTLIEVMLVMTIIVIMASFAVMAYGPIQRRAYVNQAKIQVQAFKDAIDRFNLDVGFYPSDLQDLRNPPSGMNNPAKWDGPYLGTEIPADPWGRYYQYVAPGKRNPDSFDVWSMGPDGNDNTADDVGNWTMQ
jgi:general secretion pathway protein G